MLASARSFDICFSNEIAVVNSALLSEYTLVDERVKSFLLSIKAWAKLYRLSSAAESRISSYAWVNLGIFYLQCIGFVPNLQCRELMAQHGFVKDPANWSYHVNDLDTCFMPWNLVATQSVWSQSLEWKDTPVTLLLYGFFHFYAKQFPSTLFAVSILEGGIKLPKTTFEKVRIQNLCVEDPFETHGSHAPHDLGQPAGEVGHAAIAEVLRDSEEFLRRHLIGEDKEVGGYFWRLTEVAETPPEIICISMHENPPDMDPSAQNYSRAHQFSRKGRSGGNAGRGKGRGGRGPEKLNGDHDLQPRKNGANNPYQRKAAMQPPRKNGVKLTPNNGFQGKHKRGDAKKGTASPDPKREDKRHVSRRSKKQTPDKNNNSGDHPVNDKPENTKASSPGESDDKNSPSNPSGEEKHRHNRSLRGGRAGRGGRGRGQNRGKKTSGAGVPKDTDVKRDKNVAKQKSEKQ